MIRMFSERQMRRRMGKSARQWKKLRKAERRGQWAMMTRAKQVRRAMIMTGERGCPLDAARLVKGNWAAMVIGR